MEKDSFVLHADWEDAISALNDEDAGKLFKAIYAYNCDGTEPRDLPPMAKIVFLMTRSFFDASAEKYRKICERNRANASRRDPEESEDSEEDHPHQDKKASGNFGKPKEAKKASGNFGKPKKTSGTSWKAKKASGSEYEYEYDYDYDYDYESPKGDKGGARACARERPSPPAPGVIPPGIKMTDYELAELQRIYPDRWIQLIQHLYSYMQETKKKYSNHFATIVRWAKQDNIPEGVQKSYDIDDFFNAAVEKAERKRNFENADGKQHGEKSDHLLC